jgi:hypothetical protein
MRLFAVVGNDAIDGELVNANVFAGVNDHTVGQDNAYVVYFPFFGRKKGQISFSRLFKRHSFTNRNLRRGIAGKGYSIGFKNHLDESRAIDAHKGSSSP